MRIGLYGGTFDPVHKGHLKVAIKTLEQFNLDELWFMPAKIPPHKQTASVSDENHRLNMLDLAVSELDSYKYKICKYELEKDSVSFSYLTLKAFNEIYPEHKFYFIIGEDSLRDFSKWKHPELISIYTELIVAPRMNVDYEIINRYIEEYKALYNSRIHILKFPLVEISSTDIRNRVKDNIDFKELLPDRVYDYIIRHNLYK